jgi:hypothetical protein
VLRPSRDPRTPHLGLTATAVIEQRTMELEMLSLQR